jgi:hypothetical protein
MVVVLDIMVLGARTSFFVIISLVITSPTAMYKPSFRNVRFAKRIAWA